MLYLILLAIVLFLALALVSGLLSLLEALSDAVRASLVRIFPLLISAAIAFAVAALVLALPIGLEQRVLTLITSACAILAFAACYKWLRGLGKSQAPNLTLPIEPLLQASPISIGRFSPAPASGWFLFQKPATFAARHRYVADYLRSAIPEGERIAIASKVTASVVASEKPLGRMEAIQLKSRIETWVREAESILDEDLPVNFGNSIVAEQLTVSLESLASECRVQRLGRTADDNLLREVRLKHIGSSL